MLVPDRKTVRILLTRYATLRIAQAERENPVAARELQDVSYTLCVLMGTTGVREAIAKADVLLLGAEPPAADTVRADGEGGLPLAV
ncbi:DUF5133 domain-containing protein [Streptomyces sp. MS06]|uniref:DUF5133 domain-containing protein n=1 Tax=Streptomyces sp. MS06 TaxID=3385974 RepID=UPI0039A1EF17